jgi:hypothetical protein
MVEMNGIGGHMDASIKHQIQWIRKVYGIKMQDAELEGRTGLYFALADKRDYQIERLKLKLQDRGVY